MDDIKNNNIKNRTLYFGDNLEILRDKIPSGYFNLIYLDPPFNSKRNYNVLYKDKGEDSPAQVHAFEDSWEWGKESEKVFDELIGKEKSKTVIPDVIIDTMNGFKSIVGKTDMLAYLTMMTIRLIELRRVLKDTGSIYLHCDPHASHYLKIVMDKIFGYDNFRNEIIWSYEGGGRSKDSNFARKHDTILFYSKGKEWMFNMDAVLLPHTDAQLSRYNIEKNGERYANMKGKLRKLGEGKIPSDTWTDIPPLSCNEKERLGYPTQKPESLLNRIIEASSKKEGWILDPFCGCGTTVAVAEELDRNWVGIDITSLAINLVRHRIEERFVDKKISINVDGLPKDLHGAETLANKDKFEFQYWVLDMIGASPLQSKGKKGADDGIDGIYRFKDMTRNDEIIIKKLIVSVKGGGTDVSDIRDLGHVINREQAEGGLFITLKHPTRDMIMEADKMGTFKNTLFGMSVPKLQILTIQDLFYGKKPELPSSTEHVNYHKETKKLKLQEKTTPLIAIKNTTLVDEE